MSLLLCCLNQYRRKDLDLLLYSSISMLLSRKIGRLQSFIILLDCLFCKFHLLPAIYSYTRQTFARVVTVSLRIFPWRLARLAILSVFLNSSAVNLKDTILDSSSTITIYCNIPCKNQYQYPFLYIRLYTDCLQIYARVYKSVNKRANVYRTEPIRTLSARINIESATNCIILDNYLHIDILCRSGANPQWIDGHSARTHNCPFHTHKHAFSAKDAVSRSNMRHFASKFRK